MNKIAIVVAISANNAIGKNNQLLWRLPADLKHFKEITTGHTIIMGRKTFDSIGKPLPNRRNIVITRNQNLTLPGAEVVNSLAAALLLCQNEKETFIIGGAEIYKAAIGICHKIYLTTVHKSYQADAFFPEIDLKIWEELEKEDHLPTENNNLAYSFSVLQRK